MAFNLFGGKRRITKGFFANSLGNKQTRGIYTFQIDVIQFMHSIMDAFHVLLIEIEQVL